MALNVDNLDHSVQMRVIFSLPGIRDYCERYGKNIVAVCEDQGEPRPLTGKTLDEVETALDKNIPLDQLNERRRWRDGRLAALAIHKRQWSKED